MDLNKRLKVINIGLEGFIGAFRDTGTEYLNLNWRPPLVSPDLLKKIDLLRASEKVAKANNEAFKRLNDSEPVLIDVVQAKEAVEGMKDKTIFHAGPPVRWEDMCGPVKGAVMGACIYEGWARDLGEAESLCSSGKISFSPCHHHRAVGPMAGILSPSMYVWAVENRTYGNRAYCSLNEGLGKVLRFGANGADVISRLKWMENVLGPSLKKAVAASENGINISSITAQALQMGDECHNRNVAATGLLLKTLTQLLLKVIDDTELILELVRFIDSNPHFYLNLSMAACKSVTDAVFGLKHSTIVSAMARNGTEIGIRVAGCMDKWFTSPAGIPEGLFFPGFSQEDANPDLGDSTVSEVAGIGGFAMASAPAIVKFVGGSPRDAVECTLQMGQICHGKNTRYQIPQLNFAGTPTGIDITKVIETGITPFINTGIAHRKPGIGQVGAGILRAPMDCFIEALKYIKI
ncbi:MAG: DUF1116 domain-containing protein [Elusimicrobia bacterium]|nr:DUF1116 domain-containing protein [Elusimicrobiota bacterium]